MIGCGAIAHAAIALQAIPAGKAFTPKRRGLWQPTGWTGPRVPRELA